MNFALNDKTVSEELRGKPKCIRRVILERGLWPQDSKRRLDYRTRKQKETKEHYGTSCCTRQLLSQQVDFQSQGSRLQEEIENQGHLCLFSPKYHCELNWIEYRWGSSNWWARKNCSYPWKGLLKVIPKSLNAVSDRLILKHYQKAERILKAYQGGVKYGTEEFNKSIYRSHQRVSVAEELPEDQ